MKFDVIFIAGPQGSGKGTQGKKLAERLGFLYWGMGEVLRLIMKDDSLLSKKIVAMDEGTLLSDELIEEILKDRLSMVSGVSGVPHERGIIFDGVPRTLGQAEYLIPLLRTEGWKNMATLFITVPREESMRRLLLRAAQEGRVDDTAEAIETRFRYYDETIAPAIEYLKRETQFIEIDGTLAVETITANIISALGIE